MSLAAHVMRFMFARSDAKRDAGLCIPAEVEYRRNLPYLPGGAAHTLDICWPKAERARWPLIVSIHGGGYVYGSTKQYQFYCADLARRGFAVVNFNYRLAPRHRFPAPLEDTNAVFAWLRAHRDAYPVDLDNVLIVGDSAGAQLASQYAAIWASPAYQAVMGIVPPAFTLRGVGLNCGMYDLRAMMGEDSLRSVLRDYFTRHPERFGEKLNPLVYIDGRYPPVSIFSAKGDFLLAHCGPMAALLRERGVDCDCHVYGDETTGHVFHLDPRSPIGRQANDEQIAFLRQFLTDGSRLS